MEHQAIDAALCCRGEKPHEQDRPEPASLPAVDHRDGSFRRGRIGERPDEPRHADAVAADCGEGRDGEMILAVAVGEGAQVLR